MTTTDKLFKDPEQPSERKRFLQKVNISKSRNNTLSNATEYVSASPLIRSIEEELENSPRDWSFTKKAIFQSLSSLYRSMNEEVGSPRDWNSRGSEVLQSVSPLNRSIHEDEDSPRGWNSSKQEVLQSDTEKTKTKETVNVLYGLSGNLAGFMDEFEVSLKSVLVNSPLDHDLTIHIIVDEAAHKAASERILGAPAKLKDSIWRNKITIRFYLVTPALAKTWMDYLSETLKVGGEKRKIDYRVTIGGFYRLFASRILPPGIGNVIYMDTDVVVMANLQEVWQYVTNIESQDEQQQKQQRHLFMLGQTGCSGFMVLNVDRFHQFWDYLKRIPSEKITQFHDQYLLFKVNSAFPNVVRFLPLKWSVDLATMKKKPHAILEDRPSGFGYLHFNGIRPNSQSFWKQGLMHFCERTELCRKSEAEREKFRQTWNLAEYYIKQSWELTRSWGQSMVAPGAGERLSIVGSYNLTQVKS